MILIFFLQLLLLVSHFDTNSATILRNEVARVRARALLDAAKARVNLIKAKTFAKHPVLLGAAPNPVLTSRLQKRHYYPDIQDQQVLEAKNNWVYGQSDDNQFLVNYWPVGNQDGANAEIIRTHSHNLPPLEGNRRPPELVIDKESNSTDFERHAHPHFHSHHVFSHVKNFGKGHDFKIPVSTHVDTPNVNVHVNQHQTTVVTPFTSHQIDWNEPPSRHNPNPHQSHLSFASASSISSNQAHAVTREFVRESTDEEVPQFFIEEPAPEPGVVGEQLFANELDRVSNFENSDLDQRPGEFLMRHGFSDVQDHYEGETADFDELQKNIKLGDLQFGDMPQGIDTIRKFEEEKFMPSLVLTHLDGDPNEFNLRRAGGEEMVGTSHIQLAPEQEVLIPTSDVQVASPYLFDISRKKYKDKRRYERSATDNTSFENDILKSDLEMIGHIDELLRNKANDEPKVIKQRAVSLSQLINDPNVKVDIPKTMENIGAATRHALENEKAPLYHLKNLIGSTKNTVLSAMRVPPQNLVVPSNYEIIKSVNDYNENVGDINPALSPETGATGTAEDPLGIYQTFRRVGEVIRDSVKSGQDTATHIGDVAHDAKSIIHTAKYSTPKIIKSPTQATSALKTVPATNKLMLITPKIIDVTDSYRLGKPAADSNPNFVKLGHIMDAVGVSNPNSPEPDLQKIILEPGFDNTFDIVGKPLFARANSKERVNRLFNRFRGDDLETVGQTLNNLENARISVGARSLQDFLTKLRSEFLSLFRQPNFSDLRDRDLPKASQKVSLKPVSVKKSKLDKDLDHEVDNFVDDLLTDGKQIRANDKFLKKLDNLPSDKNPENVGGSFLVDPGLLKPFMGQPTKAQIIKYLRDNGNDVDDGKLLGKSPTRTIFFDEPLLREFMEYLKEKHENEENLRKSRFNHVDIDDTDPKSHTSSSSNFGKLQEFRTVNEDKEKSDTETVGLPINKVLYDSLCNCTVNATSSSVNSDVVHSNGSLHAPFNTFNKQTDNVTNSGSSDSETVGLPINKVLYDSLCNCTVNATSSSVNGDVVHSNDSLHAPFNTFKKQTDNVTNSGSSDSETVGLPINKVLYDRLCNCTVNATSSSVNSDVAHSNESLHAPFNTFNKQTDNVTNSGSSDSETVGLPINKVLYDSLCNCTVNATSSSVNSDVVHSNDSLHAPFNTFNKQTDNATNSGSPDSETVGVATNKVLYDNLYNRTDNVNGSSINSDVVHSNGSLHAPFNTFNKQTDNATNSGSSDSETVGVATNKVLYDNLYNRTDNANGSSINSDVVHSNGSLHAPFNTFNKQTDNATISGSSDSETVGVATNKVLYDNLYNRTDNANGSSINSDVVHSNGSLPAPFKTLHKQTDNATNGGSSDNADSSDSVLGTINHLLFERISNHSLQPNDRNSNGNLAVSYQDQETSEEKATKKLQKILDAYDQGGMANWDDFQNELYNSHV